MNSVFSADEIDDSFFVAAAAAADESGEMLLGRSQSEWALHKLLEEVSSSSPTPKRLEEVAGQVFGDRSSDPSLTAVAPPIDPEERHAYLKNRLDLACAAFARSRESAVNAGNSVCFSESRPQVLVPSPLTIAASDSMLGASVTQHSASSGPPVPMVAPIIEKNPSIQVKQATSDSSREDSDDDELEGDTGTTTNKDPAEERRIRRMQSNRESARRSRRRKQDHMNELETQVGQLKTEHTTLLKRLTEMNHKYDEASVDNRILKADIETLRAKVKMAEETVKHATGINPLLLAMSNLSSADVPFISPPIDSFADRAPAMSANINSNHFFHPVDPNMSNGMNSHHPGLSDSFLSNDPTQAAGNNHNSGAGTLTGWNSGCPRPYADADPEHK
ncbi:hypothetical protein MLD38_025055 [Melastoma candidum]|uniref:Uncharacterized protein n=1 Tax=Melastoma candidum TaxID=119954 RepID=A0ACB9NUL6_9MYRT|nr:hypothetical protein MLD38_025055 [Melastoma candidum]